MARIRVYLDKDQIMGADIEPGATPLEALKEVVRSIEELEAGNATELKFNDSKGHKD